MSEDYRIETEQDEHTEWESHDESHDRESGEDQHEREKKDKRKEKKDKEKRKEKDEHAEEHDREEKDDRDDSDRDQPEEEAASAILTSVPELQVPEGGQATFNVRLSRRPPKRKVTVSVTALTEQGAVTVQSGASLRFTRNDYNRWQTVTLAGAEDPDQENNRIRFRLTGKGLTPAEITAEQVDNDTGPSAYTILTDTDAVFLAEGGTGRFQIRLSGDPKSAIAVTVGHSNGDPDISVASGSIYFFTSDNWNIPQTVTLAAAEDADSSAGEAVFAISAPGTDTVQVRAVEMEKPPDTGSRRVVIDPVSRIEGHLRIEVAVTDGRVEKAWSTATLFRGVENILSGRNPLDAPLITQRLCGVCTYVHNLCSIRAIEDAADVRITDNARLVRNLQLGAQFLHDHIVHFFQLHGLDWVDITAALAADPAETQQLAQAVSPGADPIDFAAVKSRVQGLVDTGNLGPFANAYWGHSAYTLTPAENLLVVAHYLEALKRQINAARMMAILGGKNPHPQSTIVGGVTCGGELTADRLGDFRNYLAETRRFIDTVYIPDLKVVAGRYGEWTSLGSFNHFMACGEFPQGPDIPADLFFPRGMILNGDLFNVEPLDERLITEHVARSWYEGSSDRHPASGETAPRYTGLDQDGRYSWLKAPRYDGDPMEVGPLARVLVGYGLGRPEFVEAVQNFLYDTRLSEADLLSTLGRTAARGIETRIIADAMVTWLDTLEGNLSAGNRQIYTAYSLSSGMGIGFLEAPRGALGHWIDVRDNTIGAYQMVVPTTWNLGPRCGNGIPGPLEQALVGVPVADPANPVEVIRVIHSFDPCIACGVHVIDRDSNETFQVRVS